jgi:hypothetical protein
MKDSGKSQKNMAILLGLLGLGLAYFLFVGDEETDFTAPTENKITLKKRPKLVKMETPFKESSTNDTNKSNEARVEVSEKPTETPLAIKKRKSPEVVLQEFKDLVELDFSPPSDIKFYNLELDQFEGIASHTGEEGVAVIAAPLKATVDQAIKYIKDDRSDFIFLNGQDFSKLGEPKSIPAPENSGISKITLIPGGEANGKSSYAALAERVDGRGSYLFILKTTDSSDNVLPQINQFLGTLKTKK